MFGVEATNFLRLNYIMVYGYVIDELIEMNLNLTSISRGRIVRALELCSIEVVAHNCGRNKHMIVTDLIAYYLYRAVE